MSQNGAVVPVTRLGAAIGRLGVGCCFALWFALSSTPAWALDPPARPAPPGVIIEPPHPGRDPVTPAPLPPGDGAGDTPGCPANNRKLELLV
jgi:hypothetical protein